MARKANLHERTKVFNGYIVNIPNLENLERFAALVAAAEREACAKVCDGWMHANGNDCAAAIRARSET
jgi:hypothetical protein